MVSHACSGLSTASCKKSLYPPAAEGYKERMGNFRSGLARAASLTPERRAEIARAAAAARWSAPRPAPRARRPKPIPEAAIEAGVRACRRAYNAGPTTPRQLVIAILEAARDARKAALAATYRAGR